jgi:hypothetical protein
VGSSLRLGEIIEVFEFGTVRGTEMMRTSLGWLVREKAEKDGEKVDVNVYKIPADENVLEINLDTPLETTGPSHLWKIFGTEETFDFEVDYSLRSMTRQELRVRTTGIDASNDVVRVGIRKLQVKTSKERRNVSGLVSDINLLNKDGPLFHVVKQDTHDYSKILRSLMDLEYDEVYHTDAGNSLERRTLQTITIGGVVDVPVVNPKGWVWMARGCLGASATATIHMLCGMMSLGTKPAEPCLIFFVRAKNTHPGTVKRLCKGTFTHCMRTTSPNVLVTQCQTSAEIYGEVDIGSHWRVLRKATVRSTEAKDSSKVGVLQVGDVIKTLETTVNEVGQLRIRFSKKGLKGWTSVSGADGSTLLEQLGDEEAAELEAAEAAAAAGGVEEKLGQYVCLKRVVLRADFETNSKKAGSFQEGEVVDITEARRNEKGQLRLYCNGSEGRTGWTTLEGNDGSPSLDFIGGEEAEEGDAEDDVADDESDDEVDTDDPNIGTYTVAKRAVLRKTWDPDSPRLRHLEAGEVLEVTRSKVLPTGQVRVKVPDGWTSISAGDGSTLLERKIVPQDAYSRARAAAAAKPAQEDTADQMDSEAFIDLFLVQELSCKFGMIEAESEDGKKLTTDAVVFHCSRHEAAELLAAKREEMLREPEKEPEPSFGIPTNNYSVALERVETQDLSAISEKLGEDEESKGALYVFNVTDGNLGTSWEIKKRFSQFHDLDSTFKKTGIPANQLAPLPNKYGAAAIQKAKKKKAEKTDKKVLGVVEERKKAVESYLVLATMHPIIAQSQELSIFVKSDIQDFKVRPIINIPYPVYSYAQNWPVVR